MPATPLPVLSIKDLTSDQDVRWCPGCGDYSILTQLRKALSGLGVPRENIVFVSGNGCSSRLPYYMNTYGFQTLHGRAPAFAAGLRLANPNLQIWVITGDGDGLSIGGNHLIHCLRRNHDIKILLFNNEIFGLTKGQASPTSRIGTPTKTSRTGSFETPIRPLTLALAAEATFVARTIDVDVPHLTATLQRAAAHQGTAFVEIYQNCKIFNDEVFAYATDKSVKADNVLTLEHGQPMIFGKNRDKGIRLNGWKPEIVELGKDCGPNELLRHDESSDDPTLAAILSRMAAPDFPEPIGVYRAVRRPTFEELQAAQLAQAIAKKGPGRLADLLHSGELWTVS